MYELLKTKSFHCIVSITLITKTFNTLTHPHALLCTCNDSKNMVQVEKLVYRNDYCCVPDCENDTTCHPHLSFHHFPKYTKLKKAWLIKIQRDESKNSKDPRDDFEVSTYSRHFVEHVGILCHTVLILDSKAGACIIV